MLSMLQAIGGIGMARMSGSEHIDSRGVSDGAAGRSDRVGEAWVQRKVSIKLALDSTGQPMEGISSMLEVSAFL